MTLRKKLLSILIILCILGGAIYTGAMNSEALEEYNSLLGSSKKTIHIWYTDDEITDYISSAALEFYEENDIRVVPVLVSGLEYLESINEATKLGEETPDLYIISNDSLEKAYLAGLADEVEDSKGICNTSYYSDAAINAVTYRDKIVGYPFYFETSVLLYNKTYLKDMARSKIQAEADADLAETSEAALETQVPEDGDVAQVAETTALSEEELNALVEERLLTMLPKNFADILEFANEYDAPELVEAVLKWDVSDIFYNYFFVGNTMNVGGSAGDNPENIDIYNADTISALKVYQNLNQFFSIDPDEVSYSGVLQEFIEGKIVYSMVTTDAIGKLEEAISLGQFPYEYGVTIIPDVSETIKSRSLSVTSAVVINGLSEEKEAANAFAKYIVFDPVDTLYPRTGKVPSKSGVVFENEQLNAAMEEYATSIPMTKMVEASNFWVQLEITFAKVWVGEDVNAQVKTLSEQLMTQMLGEPYEETYIEDPVVEDAGYEEYSE